jgi:hypothetical protein
MGRITDTEQGIISRLMEEIDGVDPLTRARALGDGTIVQVPVRVESYPANPSAASLKMLSASGAVLVRYAGSKYGEHRRGPGWIVQDRTMLFEIICIAESLLATNAAAGIYALLDAAALRLLGYAPPGATNVMTLEQDDYLSEAQGAWEYGLIVAVPTIISVR